MTRTDNNRRWLQLLSLLMAFGLVAAACGSSSDGDAGADDGDDGTSEGDGEAMAEGSFADCPNPLVIQTDWFPEPEHGAVYNLTAGEGSVDPESGRFSGPLAADPSITVEVRAGGPFLGDQTTIAVMATDDDIFLGYVNTDEAINNYADFPTTAVFAPLDINPQIIMFDPETYPISSWDEVKDTGAVIAHFGGATYTEFLAGSGLVDADQLDGSYDGAPTRFIAEGGALMQQGFATQEPYNYENVFTEWGKPVDFLLIHDAGFEIYQGPLTILDSKLDDAAQSCLSALVPALQQSAVDFQNDPSATNAAIVQAVTDIDSFWQLDDASVANAASEMGRLNFVGNGPNATLGDFDMDRVAEVIKITQEQVPSINVPDGITAEDLVTNAYIDESIGL